MIKVVETPDAQENVRRIIHALHYSEDIRVVSAVGSEEGPVAVAATAAGDTLFGGLAVDRSVFRKRQQDVRWLVYAAGWALPGDANTMTLDLLYQKDDFTTVVLGSTTRTGAAFGKVAMGPFDVFGTAGVPAGETIPMIRLGARKNVGANGFLQNWNIWARLLAAKQ